MPKIVANPKTRNQIQKESNERLGIKTKGFKLHIDDIAMIDNAAKALNIPQNQLIVDAVRAYVKESSHSLLVPIGNEGS